MQRRTKQSRRVSEDDAQVYLSNRVNNSWLDFFEPFDIKLVETICHIASLYPSMSENGFHLRNKSGAKNSYLFPRMSELLLPFRVMPFSDVKAVILIDEPSTKGVSTGIPFVYDLDTRPFIVTGAKEDLLYKWSPNIVLLEHHMSNSDIIPAVTQFTDVKSLAMPSLDVLSMLYMKGVMVLYRTPTSDSLVLFSHDILWKDIMQKIVSRFTEENIPVACIGQRGKDMVHNVSVRQLFECFPDIRDLSSSSMSSLEGLPNPFDFLSEFIT